ncbi:MAG: hypothetical protein HC828_16930, partial [Blastochloris sp.]|nr:hypothetical protein [Blastochloris sp.]
HKHPVPTGERDHDGTDAFRDAGFIGRKVNGAQRGLIHDRITTINLVTIRARPPGRTAIRHPVLERRHHRIRIAQVIALLAAHARCTEFGDDIRLFGIGFIGTTPANITRYSHHRCPNPVQTHSRSFGSSDSTDPFHQISIAVDGHAMLARQLYNLLSNAAKFTSAGTVTLSVQREHNPLLRQSEATALPESSLRHPGNQPTSHTSHNGRLTARVLQATQQQSWISFTISDTGIGMSEEQLQQLFQAFTQANNSSSRSYEGTGLGLTISRSLCQLMGGDVSVRSQPGKGSIFTVLLPASLPDE